MRSLLLTFIAVLTFGIVGAQVSSDYDKDVDFKTIKAFSFAGWQDGSDKVLNDLDKKRLRNAFLNEFESRNLQIVDENADVLVTLYLVIDKKTSTTAYSDFNGGMGMGYGSVRWGWGMGSATTTYTEDDYLEGTLVMDVYDAESKKLVFQATSQSVIQENPKKREKSIPKKIGKLMREYPISVVK